MALTLIKTVKNKLNLHIVHVFDIVGVIDGMVNESDPVCCRVPSPLGKVCSQDSIIQCIEVGRHRVVTFVVVTNLKNIQYKDIPPTELVPIWN